MYRSLLLLFLLLHMIGDYYLQTNKLAKNKETAYRYIVYHGLIYAAVLFTGAIILGSFWIFIALFTLATTHFLIDTIKFHIAKTATNLSTFVVHYVDQCLHIALIVIAVVLLKALHIHTSVLQFIQSLQKMLPVEPHSLLQWLCLIAFIIKPANVMIASFLSRFDPMQEDHPSSKATIMEFISTPENITIKLELSKNKPSAAIPTNNKIPPGALIGILERLIIAIFLCTGQYTAIGLVLTAKSIAWRERIKNQAFAEYFLIGTLLSTLLVIGAYLLLFEVL